MDTSTQRLIMKTKATFDKFTMKWVAMAGNKRIASPNKVYVMTRAKSFGYEVEFADSQAVTTIVSEAPSKDSSDRFNINQRFSFVEKLVNMVASGIQASAVITGEGGLGKSFTVVKTLLKNGYTDASGVESFEVGTRVNRSKMFVSVKGYSTAKGLYRTLFENNGSVIVFDDCDDVLKDVTALNLLKGALDSNDRRIISWRADLRDEDLPRSFEFTGRVIFISNMNKSKIDQAIRSRSMMIDLSMTTDQKIERMEYIASSDDFMPEYSRKVKMDAIALIRELKDEANEISFRTLISVSKIRAANEDWRDLAIYTLTS